MRSGYAIDLVFRNLVMAFIATIPAVLLVLLINSPTWYDRAVGALSVFFLISFALSVLALIRLERILILTSLVGTLAFSALVFGVGALFIQYGPQVDQFSLASVWGLTPIQLFRVQVLNLFGFVAFFVAVVFTNSLISRRKIARESGSARQTLVLNGVTIRSLVHNLDLRKARNAMLFAFLAAALIRISYFSSGVEYVRLLPGFMQAIESVGLFAVLLSTLLLVHQRTWIVVVVFLSSIALEIVNGFVTMDTGDAMAPLLVALGGFFLGTKPQRWHFIWVVIIVMVYFGMRPMMEIGRTDVGSHIYRERVSEAFLYWQKIDLDRVARAWEAQGDRVSGGSRLSYLGVQAALMEEYDRGMEGSTLQNLWWLFIPRFIAPNKPVMNPAGETGDVLVGETVTVAIGGTVFADAYWNGGWVYVGVIGFTFGVLITVLSAVTVWMLCLGNVYLWPFALLGAASFKAIAGSFAGFLGGAVIYLYLAVAVRVGFMVFSRRARRGVTCKA